ncbi:hypothetical protein NA78x_003713 [Anatilimnocola sp. NA78]|uniref:hypothetical protein n=1 Tax=Anatilimnocola sp. NA78 TaxID=3415683 RepID=UPI003CE44EFE
MNFVVRVQPEEEPKQKPMGNWLVGIAMFAAFVIPFLLLVTSARYRVLIAQAKHQFELLQRPAKSATGQPAPRLTK